MGQNIWIINHHAGKQFFSNGGRHYNFAKYLKLHNFNVTVFCCNSVHNSKAELFFDMENLSSEQFSKEIGVPFVFVKGRAYEGNGKQRVMNMIDFYLNVQKAAESYAATHGKPDVILGSSVHPLACVAAIKLAKKFNCKQIVEIRDLWPESIVAYGVASKKNALVQILYRLEKWIYAKADAIVFTMEGGKDYIIEKGWDTEHGGPVDLKKVHHINNGVDLEVFDYNREHYTVEDEDLENPDIFKVVYTGSIRLTNHVEKIVEFANHLRMQPDIRFLIFGRGDMVQSIENKIKELGLSNVILKGAVNKNLIPYILSKGNLCITDVYSNELFRYGISPNKLFEYIASGVPIVSCLPCNYDIVERFQVGVSVNADEIEAVVSTILYIKNQGRKRYEKGLEKAKEECSYWSLTNKLIEVINDIQE